MTFGVGSNCFKAELDGERGEIGFGHLPVCEEEEEVASHLFYQYALAKQVCKWVAIWLDSDISVFYSTSYRYGDLDLQ